MTPKEHAARIFENLKERWMCGKFDEDALAFIVSEIEACAVISGDCQSDCFGILPDGEECHYHRVPSCGDAQRNHQ